MKNVIVIGAGPAGITAAYELLKRGNCEVTVLEAGDQIGGISKTVRCGKNRMDIGGHRFFSKDLRAVKWWTDLMPLQGRPAYDDLKLRRKSSLAEGGPDPEHEDKVMLRRNRVSRIYYENNFYDYPVTLNRKSLKTMGLITTMKVGVSYFKSRLNRLPDDTLENYYINSFGRKLYSMFFEGYTEKVWGRKPGEIDASWGKQRTKELSITGILKDMISKRIMPEKWKAAHIQTSLIEEFMYPKYGPGQLWETAAEEVVKLGGKILMNHEVEGIRTEGEKVLSVIVNTEKSGTKELSADAFFSSMPIKDLISDMNDVPQEVANIASGLPYRDFVTVGLLVDRLNLVNETDIETLGNIVPDCWIYVQDAGVKLGRIQIFNNWSPYMVEDPEHTVWIGLEYFCNEGDPFWNLSEEECVSFAVGELKRMGIICGAENVMQSHREKVRKAYPAYFDTYKDFDQVIHYLDKFENLYCIGRNGQHRYNNMDHSMVTAFEAVDNFVGGVRTKDNIWNVNTEQEYNESGRQQGKSGSRIIRRQK